MSKTLWIAPKWPFPAQDGARVATVSLLGNYARLGRDTTLLAVAGVDESCDLGEARAKLGVADAVVVRRPATHGPRVMRALKAAGTPWIPITVSNYASPRVTREIAAVIARGWDTIVYDGLHPAIHSSSMGRYVVPAGGARVIYRAHNHETGIWERKASQTRNPVARALFASQARLVARFEHSLASAADGIATVSGEDLRAFELRTALRSTHVTPIGYDFGDAMPMPSGDALLFLGKMDWPPNRDGLVWFLREVWPRVEPARPDLSVVIAGSGESGPIAELARQPRVRFLGRVDSVESVYRETSLSLAPIFYGSGTRVKAIESARYGRACLSTAIGVEGLGLEPGRGYLQAETAEDWIRELTAVTPARVRELGAAARSSLRQRFDARTAAESMAMWIDSLGRRA